jgi:methyl-accepting chemotaxis protein
MLKNLSVGTRISGGYTVMLLTMVLMTVIGAVQVNKINTALTLINDVNGVKERYAINFRGSAHNRAIAVRDVTMVPAAELPEVVAYIDQQEAAYRKSAEPMDALFAAGSNISDAERSQLETIKAKDHAAMTLVREVIAEQKAGATAAAKAKVLDQARPAFLEWLASINVMIDGEEKLNQEQSALARGVGLDFQYLMLLLTSIAAVVGILLAILTTRSLTGPLKQMMGVLEAAAAGNLTERMDTERGDELGQMAGALNQALESTREALVQVDTMIGALASVSEDLTSAAGALEDGSKLQETGLSATTANLQQITSTARQTADHARHATLLASGKRSHVLHAAGPVAESRPVQSGPVESKAAEDVSAVAAMSEINLASKRIATVVTMVNTIAFQTSLLGLNAAVEAAHAGEEGRGFAVVATEVKNLAQRSSESATEIKGLIEDSMRKVDRGSDLVGRVTVLIGEIAAASEEQCSGIERVDQSMMAMAEVTRTNLAQAYKLTTTARSLGAEAARLRSTIDRFQL